MTGLAGLVAGAAGLIIGSFLNVVIYRVPRKESVITPGSHCPWCAAPVATRDNIPVVSWALLKGRCRSCSKPISRRYPAVELITAGLFVAMAIRFGAHAALPAYCIFAAGLLSMATIDIEHRIVPRKIVYWTLGVGGPLLGIASAVTGDWRKVAGAAIGGAIAFGAFLAVHLAVPRGMGFGDVRLAGLIGVFLGWLGLAQLGVGLFLAFLIGALAGLALIVAGRKSRRSTMPFGPFLALGALLAVFFGGPISHAWLG